jgi:hypothetical protein
LRRRRISDQNPKRCRDRGREALHHSDSRRTTGLALCRNVETTANRRIA